MIKLSSRAAGIALIVLFSSLSAAAQDYPMPGSDTEPSVICTSCPAPNTGLPTEPYSAPLSGHAGRFLDSNLVRDIQTPLRTLRARGVFAVPENDRLYMILGSGLAAYTMSTFSTRLSQGMVTLDPLRTDNTERYLPFDAYEYAESSGSGWFTVMVDGQHRLFDADFDDRRNIYLAYSTFGWGIVRDEGTDLTLQRQLPVSSTNTDTTTALTPERILSFQSGGRYYTAVGGGSAAESAIWDVTDVDPVFHRQLAVGFSSRESKAKATIDSGHVLAVVDSAGTLRVYKAADFIAGAGPSQSIAGPFRSVASDGSRFYAVSTGGSVAIVPATVADEVAPFSPATTSTGSLFTVFGASFGNGYLSIYGISSDSASTAIVRVLKVQGDGSLTPLAMNDFVDRYYAHPRSGFAVPARTSFVNSTLTYHQDGIDYIFVSMSGLGDVYKLPVITADDPRVRITLSSNMSAVAESGDTATITATIGSPANQDTVVTLGWNGTASGITDYVRSSSAITIPAGFTSGAITVTAQQDSDYDPRETVIVSVLSITNGVETGTQQVVFTINDDDPLPAPTGVVATYTGTAVRVQWSTVSGAKSYRVLRRSDTGTEYQTIADGITTTSFDDSAIANGRAYLYAVIAMDVDEISPRSASDLALVMVFTDDPLISATTSVKAVHLSELRTAVNTIRTVAGLSSATWTDAALAGTFVRVVHVDELRNALSEARSALTLAPSSFSRSLTAGSSLISAIDFTEIRVGVK